MALCWRGKFCYNKLNAPVAQWIEQETSKLLAASSILARGTIIFLDYQFYCFVSVGVRF